MSYQWYGPNGLLADGDNISGANSPSLTVDPVFSGDAGTYAVTVANAYGATNSFSAGLTVLADTNAMEDFEAGTNYVATGDFALANQTFSSLLASSLRELMASVRRCSADR